MKCANQLILNQLVLPDGQIIFPLSFDYDGLGD